MERKQLSVTPDFIILGAMKSGTTSLHSILAHHPSIFIPKREVHLFAIDDLEQFPQVQWDGNWIDQDFETYFEEYSAWYAGLYAEAKPGQLLGEDSTTYLASRRAMDRIAVYTPDAKLIILIRDPVDRLYSHYWHLVRSCQTFYSLEDTLRFQPGGLLQRSYYEEQIRYCFARFPHEQVKVIIFEEFVRSQQAVVEDVFRFLGITEGLQPEQMVYHANQGRFPRFPRFALWQNRVFRRLNTFDYQKQVPRLELIEKLSPAQRAMLKMLRLLNAQVYRHPVPMASETRRTLMRWLYKRNAGLPELLSRNLAEYWPTFREHIG